MKGGVYRMLTFVVLLTFKATEIKATATVKDWEEDGGSSEEIQ